MKEWTHVPESRAEGEVPIPASSIRFGQYMVGKLAELPATVPLSVSSRPRFRRVFKERIGDTSPPDDADSPPSRSLDELELEMNELLDEESTRYAGRLAVLEAE